MKHSDKSMILNFVYGMCIHNRTSQVFGVFDLDTCVIHPSVFYSIFAVEESIESFALDCNMIFDYHLN